MHLKMKQPLLNCVEVAYSLSQFAFFRGMVDEAGDQFVAYFLPTEENLGKRKRDAELEQDYAEEEE